MKSSIHRWIPLAALIVASVSCDRGSNADNAAAEEAGDAATNRIDIPATVRSNLGITFAKVERRQVSDTLRVPGSFELTRQARIPAATARPGALRNRRTR
jgi:hypothetical protein